MMKIRLFIVFYFLCLSPVHAVVLDWSGSYEIQAELVQSSALKASSFYALHNLHLRPDIKAFDGLSVRSWLQLTQPSMANPMPSHSFYYQEGPLFGLSHGQNESPRPPTLELKHVYLEIIHDFGRWEMGWKPQHFGLGMHYNDGRQAFSPVYNAYGSRGFLSWKGFIGSAYYIQPTVHYLQDMWFNILIQGGWQTDNYGIEGIYKWTPVGPGDTPINVQKNFYLDSYFGLYAYYKQDRLTVQTEIGGDSRFTYGGVLDIDWDPPWERWDMGLDLGLSFANPGMAVFHFDPSFSTGLSFLRAGYEKLLSPEPPYLKQYLFYSFHSGFYAAPSVSFAWSDSWSVGSTGLVQFPLHGGRPFYGGDIILTRQVLAGLKWSNNLGILFPPEDNWYFGINSRVVIAF